MTSKRWLRRRLFLKSRPLHSKRNVFKNGRRNKDVKSHASHWGQLGWRKEAYNGHLTGREASPSPGSPPPQYVSGIPSYTPPWGAMTWKVSRRNTMTWPPSEAPNHTSILHFQAIEKSMNSTDALWKREEHNKTNWAIKFFHDTCKIQSSYLFQLKYHLLNPLYSFFITTKMCKTSQQL